MNTGSLQGKLAIIIEMQGPILSLVSHAPNKALWPLSVGVVLLVGSYVKHVWFGHMTAFSGGLLVISLGEYFVSAPV